MTDDTRDWRSWAYLQRSNWPECIPDQGPKRKHGPYPWNRGYSDATVDGEPYPWSHPDAGSIGHEYLGEVCPRCGVPIHAERETVVTTGGERGTVLELTDMDDPEPVFHTECYAVRKGEGSRSLSEWVSE